MTEKRRKNKPRVDAFLAGMVLMVILAWLFPGPGSGGGWMRPDELNKWGATLVFFLHGLAIPFQELRRGTRNWPLHLLVQAMSFVIFPLLGWGILAALGGGIPVGLAMGLFYLCALPSTVSSSIALTATAHGNVAAALFNANLSNILGVVMTPLWLSWVLGMEGGTGKELGEVFVELALRFVLPMIVGQLLRPMLAAWVHRHKAWVNRVDRGTILLLVYTSFCASFAGGVWEGHGAWMIVVTGVGMVALFGLVVAISSLLAKLFRLPKPDLAVLVFCGSKKSMATGVPMANLIFAGNPMLGFILLPIMLYHPLQLLVGGVLAGRWGRAAEHAAEHAAPVAKG